MRPAEGVGEDPFPYRSASELGAEERRFLDELGDDIEKNQPLLVLIPTRVCQACPRRFRISEYLTAAGWSAIHLAGYERLDDFAGHEIYRSRQAAGRGKQTK